MVRTHLEARRSDPRPHAHEAAPCGWAKTQARERHEPWSPASVVLATPAALRSGVQPSRGTSGSGVATLAANVEAVTPAQGVLAVVCVACRVASYRRPVLRALTTVGVAVPERGRKAAEVHGRRRGLRRGARDEPDEHSSRQHNDAGMVPCPGGRRRPQRRAGLVSARGLGAAPKERTGSGLLHKKRCPTREAIGQKESADAHEIGRGDRFCVSVVCFDRSFGHAGGCTPTICLYWSRRCGGIPRIPGVHGRYPPLADGPVLGRSNSLSQAACQGWINFGINGIPQTRTTVLFPASDAGETPPKPAKQSTTSLSLPSDRRAAASAEGIPALGRCHGRHALFDTSRTRFPRMTFTGTPRFTLMPRGLPLSGTRPLRR